MPIAGVTLDRPSFRALETVSGSVLGLTSAEKASVEVVAHVCLRNASERFAEETVLVRANLGAGQSRFALELPFGWASVSTAPGPQTLDCTLRLRVKTKGARPYERMLRVEPLRRLEPVAEGWYKTLFSNLFWGLGCGTVALLFAALMAVPLSLLSPTFFGGLLAVVFLTMTARLLWRWWAGRRLWRSAACRVHPDGRITLSLRSPEPRRITTVRVSQHSRSSGDSTTYSWERETLVPCPLTLAADVPTDVELELPEMFLPSLGGHVWHYFDWRAQGKDDSWPLPRIMLRAT